MYGVDKTHYDELGVDPSADPSTLRAAYRDQALRYHPDRQTGTSSVAYGDSETRMAAVNEAWTILSHPQRRAAYDLTLVPERTRTSTDGYRVTTTIHEPGAPTFVRREAWMIGIRLQAVRHTREAVTSASWALSLKRHGRPRAVYEAQLDAVVCHVMKNTAERIKAARAAGTAPLDLGLATALVGVRDMAQQILDESRAEGTTIRHEVLAELLDKSWDNLAHGVSHEVETALGTNPRASRSLSPR